MQIWFSCLYESDRRKIDAQIRCNKFSLGIFCVSNEEKSKLARDFDECHGNERAKRVRPGEKEDIWKYEKKIKEIRMRKSLR